jgi:hypothetical protein
MTDILSVAKDFSEIPGPRLRHQGDHSGQEFYEDFLYPRFVNAVRNDSKLTIDLDEVEGYATVFLDESFGKLARVFGSQTVRDHLDFKSEEDPTILSDIEDYIRSADSMREPDKLAS